MIPFKSTQLWQFNRLKEFFNNVWYNGNVNNILKTDPISYCFMLKIQKESEKETIVFVFFYASFFGECMRHLRLRFGD